MVNIQYLDETTAFDLSGIRNYPAVACNAIREMYRQVGDLQIDEHGIAFRGLIIRHLILPENLAGTVKAIDFIADSSMDTYLNLMDQYHPAYFAHKDKRINRRITPDEYNRALDLAREHGLHRLAK